MAPRLRLLLLLLPAGCAAPGEREAIALRQALESGQASLAAVAPPGLPATMVLAAPPGRPRPPGAAHRALRPAAPAGPRPSRAADLLGAGPETLRHWLGEPALRRPEGSAEVWLYAGPGCALDLILYPARHGLAVAHAAARAQGTESRTEAACLGEIAGAPLGGPIPAASGPPPRPTDPDV